MIKCTGCGKRNTIELSGSSPQESTAVEKQADEIEMVIPRRFTLPPEKDMGGRKMVAQFFVWASARLAAKAHEEMEKTGFKRDHRSSYPEVPGEEHKNSNLQEQREKYGGSSRAPSFVSSKDSFDNGEGPSRDVRSLNRRTESCPIPSPLPTRHRQDHDHFGSLPNNGLLHSASLERPQSPGAPPRGWPGGLSPFSDQGPRRTRADSGSTISPTTLSPPTQTPFTLIVTPDVND